MDIATKVLEAAAAKQTDQFKSINVEKHYVEINQQNALKLYTSLFFYNGYMFRQNNAILRARLCSFLSHFSVNMVGDKS
jgi:hypothetical protein